MSIALIQIAALKKKRRRKSQRQSGATKKHGKKGKSMEQLQHPDITACERWGYPRQVKYPVCPVCDAETDTFYRDRDGEICGCDNCVKAVDAWEVIANAGL